MARTVREALIEWGWQDLIPATHEVTLRSHVGEGFPKPMVAADGAQAARLFVICSGEVLFRLPSENDRMRGSLYLIRDDESGRAWDAERRRHTNAAGVVEYFDGYHTARPSPCLRIVESA